MTVTAPGKAGKPELVSSSTTEIKVSWSPAYDDGGSPIQAYVLEMDEVKPEMEEEAFAEVARGEILTYAAEVEPLKQYRFRVMAVNEQQL